MFVKLGSEALFWSLNWSDSSHIWVGKVGWISTGGSNFTSANHRVDNGEIYQIILGPNTSDFEL